MATKIVFDYEQGAAFTRRTGHMNPGEMLKGTKDLVSDPLFKSITKILTDISAADFSDISVDEVESYTRYCTPILKSLKIAVYAPNDLSFGLSRMFKSLSDKENILIARDMNDALSWLDVTLPEDF